MPRSHGNESARPAPRAAEAGEAQDVLDEIWCETTPHAETYPDYQTEKVAAAPTDDTTGRVSAAWAEVLERENVPSEVNFFDLGGHSFKLFELQNALEQHTGVRLSIVGLFSHTTVAAQATLIRDGVPSDDGSAVVGRAASDRRARALRARRQRLEGGERR